MNHPWKAVFLARHGQTEWNVQRRRQGQLDSPLTDQGRTQAARHAAMLRSHRIDVVFSSPQGRARTTAQIIADHLDLPVVVETELAEVHHGQWAGLSDEEIQASYPTEWQHRSRDLYLWRFPGGESYADADARAARALARIAAHPACRPLIVSHEMFNRMLQRHLLRIDPHQALTNRHPNDVVYEFDPYRCSRRTLSQSPDDTTDSG